VREGKRERKERKEKKETNLLINSFLNPSSPLLRRLPVQQSNDDDSHVVASNPSKLGIRSKALLHHILRNLGQSVSVGDGSSSEVDDLLRGKAVPDTCSDKVPNKPASTQDQPRAQVREGKKEEIRARTITRDDEELLLSGRLMNDDIRIDGNDLMLSVKRVVLLEFEISNSSREGEVSC